MAIVPNKYVFIKESNGNVTMETYKGTDLIGTTSLNPAKDIRISESYPESIIIPYNTTGNHIDNKFVSIPWTKIDFVGSTPTNTAPTTINEAVALLGQDFFFELGGGGGGGASVINTTHSALLSSISAGTLVEGSWYRITDFQTIYDQADYDSVGSLKAVIETKTGAVEPLLVLALSDSEISAFAYSENHPEDKIKYDVNYTTTFINGAPAKGKIVELIDEWNNRTDYDHRTVKFIRYEDAITGNFTVINDNGGTRQEFLTFGNTYATNSGEVIKDNFIGNFGEFSDLTGLEFANNVFHFETFGYGNKLGVLCFNNTWGDNNNGNTWGNGNNGNIWGDDNKLNTWGNDNALNVWGNDNALNVWGGGNEENIWGSNNTSNALTNQIINKDFTLITELQDAYDVLIFKASTNDVYYRYFNGTTDVNTLIP